MNYWDKYLKKRALSIYLQDWADVPKWTVDKAKAMEDEIVALKQERDAMRDGMKKFIKKLGEEYGYYGRDW